MSTRLNISVPDDLAAVLLDTSNNQLATAQNTNEQFLPTSP